MPGSHRPVPESGVVVWGNRCRWALRPRSWTLTATREPPVPSRGHPSRGRDSQRTVSQIHLAALAHRPDLILIDILLPVLDGYEATPRIKDGSVGVYCRSPM